MDLTAKSEYVSGFSKIARQRYVEKVLLSGLKTDPYCLVGNEWHKNPEKLPEVSWSDVFTYMISTPSPYTKEAVKVKF